MATFLKGPNSAGSVPSGHVSIEGVVDLPPLGIKVLSHVSCEFEAFPYSKIFCWRTFRRRGQVTSSIG